MAKRGPNQRGGAKPGGTPRVPTRSKPPLSVFVTTLWEYPSQHYGPGMQGDKNYAGATPSWVIWQLLQRYTTPKDLVVDPMCGSGTTLDVARDLGRRALGYDLNPQRDDIFRVDARRLPLEDAKADFVFIDPPYSTHIDYSDDPRCIGKLDAAEPRDAGAANEHAEHYYDAMASVIAEIDRVLKPGAHMGLYVSDSFRKGKPFMPIGFELFALLRQHFEAVDIIAVVRHNEKLGRGNWRKAAEEGNFFLRGFNYLFIMRKPERSSRPTPSKRAPAKRPRQKPKPRSDANPNAGSKRGAKPGRRPRGGSAPKKRPPRRGPKRGGA
jgi:DNA modification methylase